MAAFMHTPKRFCRLAYLERAVRRQLQAEKARVCHGKIVVRGGAPEALQLEALAEALRSER